MKNINILPSNVANKIAAGEVVERPASIVKELVENSIDGQSSVIEVFIENGGKDKIEVVDNGVGIKSEDVHLAFKRHATSKIENEKDLESIISLGFRGEALPSIAAVSKVEVLTKTSDDELGVRYKIDGGIDEHLNSAPANKGTRFVVQDLFFNTPARKKFLKTTATELGYITDLMGRFVLCNPDISFKLYHNNRRLIASTGNGSLKQAISDVLGTSAAENALKVDNQSSKIDIQGYVVKPSITKSNRSGQFIFINNRIVRSKLLSKALEDGYKTLLPQNRYPLAVLKINLPPEGIDVNVHPSKQEVKFDNERIVYQSLKAAVDSSLLEKPLVTEYKYTNVSKNLQKEKTNPETSKQPSNKELNTFTSKPKNVNNTEKQLSYLEKLTQDLQIHEEAPKEAPTSKPMKEDTPSQKSDQLISRSSLPQKAEAKQQEIINPFFTTLQILGQFSETYVICKDSDNLYLIDQHAAQEKIFYEKAINQLGNQVAIQGIIPESIKLNGAQIQIVDENADTLKKLGFDLEIMDGNNILVRGLPFFVNKSISIQLLIDSLEDIFLDDELNSLKKFKEAILALISCKGAIKANHKLSHKEMTSLLEQLSLISNPYSCPHGRPTVVSLDKKSIEKMFKRVK
ncbi:DNA mismatch repair endonuclease MutL [Proteinivorax hydrogeniformans]|uniref:DNA mismatch repair protein MutL n=1 Tax=Proteinivorax hydrogeniformans TaxID=1826727 RepID=A0AAU8HX78_9FIRM